MYLQLPVTPGILNLVSLVDHFKGVWAAGTVVPPDRLGRLREVARIQSTAASCRMGGVKVSEAEVAAILRGDLQGMKEAPEVIGYAEALDRCFPAESPVVTTEEIRRLHAVMVGSLGNPPEPSPWREEVLHLEVFDQQGRAVGRVFQTLPPRLIPEKVESLVSWLEIELLQGTHHPLLVTGAFMLGFLAASPFAMANGRIARLVTGHLLRRAGYQHLPYASLEKIMEEMRETYYEAFDAAETKLWTGEADLSPWIEFFLSAVRRQADRVAAKMDLERRALGFTPLQRQIIETVREHGTVGAGLLLRATGANRNTLKDNLRRLVEQGVLERTGARRGALYQLASGDALPEPAAVRRAPGPAREVPATSE